MDRPPPLARAELAADLRRYAALPEHERSPRKLRWLLEEAAQVLDGSMALDASLETVGAAVAVALAVGPPDVVAAYLAGLVMVIAAPEGENSAGRPTAGSRVCSCAPCVADRARRGA